MGASGAESAYPLNLAWRLPISYEGMNERRVRRWARVLASLLEIPPE